ncbi:MAG: recombination mediator RecR [Candidatus Algichlamydia australiensis]|nr:recombination mediator RecR [Chlamydiales bacterium]
MQNYPQELKILITHLKRLPGVGQKSAERFAFHLLKEDATQLKDFGETIAKIQEKILHCSECGLMLSEKGCFSCHAPYREKDILCIISSPRDAFAIEATRSFKGAYHVIDGLLSPVEGKTPDTLGLEQLKKRIEKECVKELLIALDATLEGDATALFLKQEFAKENVKVTRLALGLPMGSSLDWIDEGTLGQSIIRRQELI